MSTSKVVVSNWDGPFNVTSNNSLSGAEDVIMTQVSVVSNLLVGLPLSPVNYNLPPPIFILFYLSANV